MTAPAQVAASIDDRIAGLFLAGHGIDFITERGVVLGWSRARIVQVVKDRRWTLERSGKLTANHLQPSRPARARPRPAPSRPAPPRPVLRAVPEPQTGARVVRLSAQQQAVVDQLCADGATNRAIGQRLNIAEDTVKSHMKAAMLAAGCGSRTELAVAVLTGQVQLARAKYGQTPRC